MSELNCKWTISKVDYEEVKQNSSYEQCIHKIADFGTVEEFWQIFSHLMKPSEIGDEIELEIFRKGYRAIWEDSVNQECGKWYLVIKKEYCDLLWEQSILALIGEQLDENIIGVTISSRSNSTIISYWIKTSKDEGINEIASNLAETLNLPEKTKIGFKYHDKAVNKPREYIVGTGLRPPKT